MDEVTMASLLLLGYVGLLRILKCLAFLPVFARAVVIVIALRIRRICYKYRGPLVMYKIASAQDKRTSQSFPG
jgi:hypothetical protein